MLSGDPGAQFWKVFSKHCGGAGGRKGLLPTQSPQSTAWGLRGMVVSGRRGHDTTLPHLSGLVASLLGFVRSEQRVSTEKGCPSRAVVSQEHSSCGAAIAALSPCDLLAFEALKGWCSETP